MEMPLYQSHKKVRALEIAQVTQLPATTMLRLTFVDARYPEKKVDGHKKPTPKPGWFYVVYPPDPKTGENYHSFSPPDAFRDGYSMIDSRGEALGLVKRATP